MRDAAVREEGVLLSAAETMSLYIMQAVREQALADDLKKLPQGELELPQGPTSDAVQ